MRLLSFQVDGFGVLHDTGIDPVPRSLTVILGDNGAGKTTLLRFLRALLFGFRAKHARVPIYEPLRGGSHGGSAVIEMSDGHRYRIIRSADGSPEGQSTVMSLSDDAPNRDLSAILGQATRDVFENVFAFSLEELQEVGTLDQENIRSRLDAAGAGTGASSLPDVRRKIDDEGKAILNSRSSKARLSVIVAELRELRERQTALSRDAERYAELGREQAQLATRLAEAARAEAEASAALNARQAERDAWPDWRALIEARQALDAVPDVPPMPEGAEERLNAAKQAAAQRLEAVQQAAEAVKRAQAEVDASCARLGDGWTEERVVGFDAGQTPEQAAAEIGRQMAEAAQQEAKADAAVRHADEALREAASAREALEAEERQRWPSPPRTMDAIEHDLGTLREARAAATRLAEERAGRATLEARRQGAEDELKHLRVAPEPVAQPAHIPLIVTFGLLAASAALVSFSPLAAGVLFVLFLLSAAVAIRMHRKARSVVRAQRQEEIREAEGRLKDVDDKLAAADEAIARQLAHLKELAGRIGVERASSVDDLDPAESRLMEERDSARAYAEFGERLRGARRTEAKAADALEAARKALAEAQTERAATDARWQAWLQEIGIPAEHRPDTALQFIEQVRAARTLIAARDQRAAEHADAVARADEARKAVEAAIAETGDADEEAFLRHASAWRALQEARRRVDAAAARLAARAGSEERSRALEETLAATDETALVKAVDAARDAHRAARERADQLRTRDGEIKAEMRALEASEEIESVGRAIAGHVTDAERALEEWAIRRICVELLDEARTKFERERQPAVIRRAGEHLHHVTGGSYTRILRRLESNELEAEAADGTPKARPAWNRGLLEQIYLCLRLGYIEDYSASTEPLPVVMDDVFANFDPHHARRAADLIARFALGHQVLYLTCHPETVEFLRASQPEGAAFYRLTDGALQADP